MKEFLLGLLKKVTSRKFLLTLGTALVFYSNEQYQEMFYTILAYVGFEGIADAVRAYSEKKYVAPVEALRNDGFFASDPEDDIDRTTVVPGQ